MLVFFTNFSLMGFQVRYLALFLLFSVIDGFKWFMMTSLQKVKSGQVKSLFDWSKNTGAINVKMDGSVLEEKLSFRILGLTFSSKLDWGSYTISIAKTAFKKIRALIHSMKFLSPEVSLYLYKSTKRPDMEYCCHVWAGAPSCYLELLDKLQKRICRTIGPSLATSLELSAHCQNVASLGRFYSYYFGKCSSELAQLAPLPFCIRYSDRLHDFSVTIPKVIMISMTIECFPLIAPIECFPLTFG